MGVGSRVAWPCKNHIICNSFDTQFRQRIIDFCEISPVQDIFSKIFVCGISNW